MNIFGIILITNVVWIGSVPTLRTFYLGSTIIDLHHCLYNSWTKRNEGLFWGFIYVFIVKYVYWLLYNLGNVFFSTRIIDVCTLFFNLIFHFKIVATLLIFHRLKVWMWVLWLGIQGMLKELQVIKYNGVNEA